MEFTERRRTSCQARLYELKKDNLLEITDIDKLNAGYTNPISEQHLEWLKTLFYLQWDLK